MKAKKEEKRTVGHRRMTRPPLKFQMDLRYAASTLRRRAILCGIGKDMVRRIMDGLPVSVARLEMAMTNFYKRESDSLLRTQMVGMIDGSTAASWTFLRLLRGLAGIVQNYGEAMKLGKDIKAVYVFPPRDTIVKMIDAIAAGEKVLKEIHKICPEYDSLVFRNAKALLKKFKKADEAAETEGQNEQV